MNDAVDSVLIVGAGLLGTSLGLALRRHGVTVHLVDALPGRAQEAADLGAGTSSPPQGQVDVAVVCTPPAAVGKELARLQRSGAARTYTDVASVQARPLADVCAMGLDLTSVVLSHPLAGREIAGPRAARSDLFDGRPWVLTPSPESAPEAVARVESLVKLTGAAPVLMSPAEHDDAVAVVSHVPHVLAVLAAARLAEANDEEVAIAGQGVRDVTRIAAGDPTLWTEILQHNAGPVAALLSSVRDDLDLLLAGLTTPGATTVSQVLQRGNVGRARIPGKHGGPATPYVVVPVVVPDRAGELGRLFDEVGRVGVNIEDLRIEHSPGQPVGLAELSVRPDVADHLADALRARGWTVHAVS
ncbi:MAG: prephenate dehydrogenase [Actinomycetes bacterium]